MRRSVDPVFHAESEKGLRRLFAIGRLFLLEAVVHGVIWPNSTQSRFTCFGKNYTLDQIIEQANFSTVTNLVQAKAIDVAHSEHPCQLSIGIR